MPLVSLTVAVYGQGKKRHFPRDVEFREALETRDVYDMPPASFASRITRDVDSDWKVVQETWLHRLGNPTLNGCNSTYSDRPLTRRRRLQVVR